MARRKNDDGAIRAQIIAGRDGKPSFAVLPFEVFMALAAYAREGVENSKKRVGDPPRRRRDVKYTFENTRNFLVKYIGETANIDRYVRNFLSHPTDLEWETTLERVGDWLALEQDAASVENDFSNDLDEDLAAYDAAGIRDEERFPAEVADRLIAGESPLKVFREYRGLTQGRLAEAAKTTAPYLSQIENGRRTGSVGLLQRLADALRVEIDDLV